MAAEKLSLQEKIELVLICGDNYQSSRRAAEIFNDRHPGKNVHHSTVARLLNNFKEDGSVDSRYKVPHRRPVTNEDASLQVMLSTVENPLMPLSQRREHVGMSERSMRRVLVKNKFRAYRPKFVHVLQDRDYDARLDFCFWMEGKREEDRDFFKMILFTDEATFSSNGVVSSQNCRWWADENPNFAIEARNQHHFKVNVWCGILNTQIVGPFFFRQNLTSESYLHFLHTEILNFLHELPLEQRRQLFYQHDGAPAHSTLEVREWLDHTFQDQWIGRYSANPWPARSPDITPLDLFLWGYLKRKVYAQRPFRDVQHLEEMIRQCVNSITPYMLRNVLKELHFRTIRCIELNGGHVEMHN